nr:zinc ribbon domain-containing protein [Candidatus Njordarchaeum guaymaensis]
MESRLSCPYCGTPIKGTENFCRYCGRLVRGKISATSGAEEVSSVELEIPQDILEQIDIRAQVNSIENKLKTFRDEVDEMDTLLNNADIQLSEYKDRIAKLREETRIAKESRSQLEERKKSFPFEVHKRQFDELKEKISKLEKLRSAKQVTDEAYRSLSREYQLKKRELENVMISDTANMKNWINFLNVEKNSAQKQLSILSARQAVGDLSDKDYAEEKKKLQNRLALAEVGIEILKKYIP